MNKDDSYLRLNKILIFIYFIFGCINSDIARTEVFHASIFTRLWYLKEFYFAENYIETENGEWIEWTDIEWV